MYIYTRKQKHARSLAGWLLTKKLTSNINIKNYCTHPPLKNEKQATNKKKKKK
jgi:hypothetical protein